VVHLAVVLDPASRVLTSYVDGTRAGQAANVAVTAAQLLDQAAGTPTASTSAVAGRFHLDAARRMRDVRIYRIALTDQQVATSAVTRFRAVSRRGRGAPVVVPSAAIPWNPRWRPAGARPDIAVETTVGDLPRLRTRSGRVPQQRRGPDVRVVWPAPKDNNQVLKPGTYTVTGGCPARRSSAATVTVKAPSGTSPFPSAGWRRFRSRSRS